MNHQDPMPLESELQVARQRLSPSLHANLTRMALCLCLGLLATGCTSSLETKADTGGQTSNPALGAVDQIPNPLFNGTYSDDADVLFVEEPTNAMAQGSGKANFGSEGASRRTRDMANWAVTSRDNRNMPFAIVDKINAKVYVFGADGNLHGAAPVLLGLGIGDEVAPGVGSMRMGLIPPEHRTTPAGRFEAVLGHNSRGKEILWVDYNNAISMHPVVTNNPKERRAERLASPTPADNRISFGCINVPPEFFKNVIHNKFSGTRGIVYVLPETKRVATK